MIFVDGTDPLARGTPRCSKVDNKRLAANSSSDCCIVFFLGSEIKTAWIKTSFYLSSAEFLFESWCLWCHFLQSFVLMHSLLPQLHIHLNVSSLEVSLCILCVQGDSGVTICQGFLISSHFVECRGPIEMDRLVVGSI